MKRALLLKWINPALGILLLSQVLTGLLADELSHETFEIVHVGGGVTLAVLGVVHVILNWAWVKATYLKRPPVGPA